MSELTPSLPWWLTANMDDKQKEIYRLQGVVCSQVDALNHWRKEFDAEHGARLLAEEKFAKHTAHVGTFLSEMYATMIDPLADGEIKVAETTAALIDAARQQREELGGGALEARVAAWKRSRIGEAGMYIPECAARFLEEALELAQAEGVSWQAAAAHLNHVYHRPVGEATHEGAGAAVALLGWCAARGIHMRDLILYELARIEAKPIEQVLASHQRKVDAGLVQGESK